MVISLWSITGITSQSIAQEPQGIKNILAINPVGILLFGVQNVEYERALTSKSGIALYWARSGVAYAKIEGSKFRSSEQGVTYRYYWGGSAPKGAWGGVNFAYFSGSIWNAGCYALNISMLALTIEAGYRWIIGIFNVSPIVMFRVPLTDNLLGTKSTSGDVKIPLTGFGVSLNLGWGW
jgi:hypothetical protein